MEGELMMMQFSEEPQAQLHVALASELHRVERGAADGRLIPDESSSDSAPGA